MTHMMTPGTRLHLQDDLGQLGERLIRFGEALQDPNTTVGKLSDLAKSCGIKLHMRAVAESGEAPNAH
ncbi:hypothetical protein D3C81_1236040 [compost metagenome]|uniref:Uncharacterized protein n=1 Tax=Pseudomonas juntendi TaxID=2666183 RepID=A0A7W2M087_9PSED|nr:MULTISPECIES: hypothetical protein [Pseudomonas]MBA6150111.1 hypothetical protein [Pseudomonas juntendi]